MDSPIQAVGSIKKPSALVRTHRLNFQGNTKHSSCTVNRKREDSSICRRSGLASIIFFSRQHRAIRRLAWVNDCLTTRHGAKTHRRRGIIGQARVKRANNFQSPMQLLPPAARCNLPKVGRGDAQISSAPFPSQLSRLQRPSQTMKRAEPRFSQYKVFILSQGLVKPSKDGLFCPRLFPI